MSICHECEHYREDRDVNYQDCELNEDEKYWFTDLPCPNFKEIPDIDIYGDDRNES